MIDAALKHRKIFSRHKKKRKKKYNFCYAPILLIRLDCMLPGLNSLKYPSPKTKVILMYKSKKFY